MSNKLRLGNAFGWDTDRTAKVAIVQLRDENPGRYGAKCPKAQLLKNESIRWGPNILKVLGYIPGINIIASVVAIAHSEQASALAPDHTAKWLGRAAAMIVCGPLLLVVDLIIHCFNLNIANKYCNTHPGAMNVFNTDHGHTQAFWPGQPVYCDGQLARLALGRDEVLPARAAG